MATLGEAVLYLLTDNSKLEAGLGDAEQKTESASAGMAKALGGAVVAGAAIAGSAILAIGSQAFDVASQVDAATDQIGASLGVGADEAKAYGETIKSIYGNNFGDSIADVGTAVETVAKQLKLAGNDPSLKKITENAYRLRDVFGTDINDSIDAAKTLMDNFGLSSQEAFDMLTRGYQVGLDRSGDFLDTIGEYSTQFANGGATAQEFFGIIEAGAAGGVLGTDKAADAFKEFRVRIQDGSTLTKTSLEQIGINADEMAAKFADGSITAKDAFDQVVSALAALDDKNIQMQAGVGLLGTQFEDLGQKGATSLSTLSTNFDNISGAADSLDAKYTNLGSVFEGMWRQFQVGIEPAGEALLGLVNENLPAIQGAVALASGAIVNAANGLVDGIANVKRLWNEDWAGIRTTWEEFATELPDEQRAFWIEWNKTFNAGSDENKVGWEAFFAAIFSSSTDFWGFAIAQYTEALKVMQGISQASHAIMTLDWSTFWEGIKLLVFSATDIILNDIEYVFGPGLRDAFAGALNSAWDNMKEIWKNISDWWNSTIGALLGMSAPTTNLGIVNPLNQPSGTQETINGILGGSGTLPLPSASAQSAGGINVTQHFYGQTDPVTVKEASQDGVQRAARTLGMR